MYNFDEYPVEEVTTEPQKRRFSPADKKGFILVVILALIAIVFISNLGNNLSKKPEQVPETTTAQPAVVTTTVPTTVTPTENTTMTTTATTTTIADTIATTTQPVTSVKQTETTQTTTAVQTTVDSTTQESEPSEEEILAAINKGINSLKSDTASFKANKKQVISIDLLECSVPALTGAINMVIDFFEGEKTAEYEITNGKGPNPDEKGEEIVVNHEIPPTDKPFSLTIDGVAEAKAEKTDKGTLYTIKVVPETSTLENPRPPHHNAACDTLDFSAFELPVGELTKVDFEYPGATVSVLVDSSGKTIQYRERLEMKGVGEGGALGISGSGSMEGFVDEVWDIEWK